MSDFPPDTRQFDLRAYERLAELFPRLLAEETRDSLLKAIADAVEELIPCSALLLYEIREEDGALAPLVVRGMLPRGVPDAFVPREASLEALAMASSRPVGLEVGGDTHATLFVGRDVEATVAAPLVVRGCAVGCLTIRRRGVGQLFGDEELRFVARLADVAAMTLDNARNRALLEDLAQTDALTGLLNRRGFFDALERILAQAARERADTSVLVADVDGLKRINDRFGHSAGDAALVRLAETLEGRTRRGDIVGRLGGDEFAVVLSGADAASAAEIRCALERSLTHAEVETPAGSFLLTASFGVASTGIGAANAEQLVARSDLDMYETKNVRKHSTRRASRH